MGEIIELREVMDNGSFRIGFSVTNEERTVFLDPEKRDLFYRETIHIVRPMACPFLRQTPDKKFVCSVHTTRPELCCQYSCYRILISDSRGKRLGKVTDASRYFTTTDADLRMLWNKEIAGIAITNEDDWELHVETILTHAGYRVIR